MPFLFSGRCQCNFGATLQTSKRDMRHITSCRKVISIEHTASAFFVVFWLVLPFRERKNFIRSG